MRTILGLLTVVGILFHNSSSQAVGEDDLLLLVPTIIAALQCDEGQFTRCRTRLSCEGINGNWADGVCSEKPENQLATELLKGKWSLVTSFHNGDFFNYINFADTNALPIRSSVDYFIEGTSHSTVAFSDAAPNYTVASYDSSNDDWFILDYWGLDQGTISSIEINRASDSFFTGCEFFLNYPDLTYQDGICNPVRMSKGAKAKIASNQNSRLSSRPTSRFKLTVVGTPARTPGSKVSKNIGLIDNATGVNHD